MSQSSVTLRPKPDTKLLTKREVFEFLKQEAQDLGEIGFTLNDPDTKAIFSQPVDLAIPGEYIDKDDDSDLLAAVDEIHGELSWLQTHRRWLDDPVNRPIIDETEADIDAHLLTGGKSKRLLKSKHLRRKIVMLIEQENPKPAPNFIKVLLDVPTFGALIKDMIEVPLPLPSNEDGMIDVLGALNCAVECKLGQIQAARLAAGKWKYQIIGKRSKKLINKASIELKTFADFRKMTRAVTGGSNFVAVMTQDGALEAASPIQQKEEIRRAQRGDLAAIPLGERGEEDAEEATEPVDEDGTPYFVPIGQENWDAAYKKVLEEAAEDGWDTYVEPE